MVELRRRFGAVSLPCAWWRDPFLVNGVEDRATDLSGLGRGRGASTFGGWHRRLVACLPGRLSERAVRMDSSENPTRLVRVSAPSASLGQGLVGCRRDGLPVRFCRRVAGSYGA